MTFATTFFRRGVSSRAGDALRAPPLEKSSDKKGRLRGLRPAPAGNRARFVLVSEANEGSEVLALPALARTFVLGPV